MTPAEVHKLHNSRQLCAKIIDNDEKLPVCGHGVEHVSGDVSFHWSTCRRWWHCLPCHETDRCPHMPRRRNNTPCHAVGQSLVRTKTIVDRRPSQLLPQRLSPHGSHLRDAPPFDKISNKAPCGGCTFRLKASSAWTRFEKKSWNCLDEMSIFAVAGKQWSSVCLGPGSEAPAEKTAASIATAKRRRDEEHRDVVDAFASVTGGRRAGITRIAPVPATAVLQQLSHATAPRTTGNCDVRLFAVASG
ncbi:unnamed protein product [Soboliphyme baturini]|uniref:Zf-RVT domain-containing protein n=1 Tax=Soboliphyme baturini TaxID=241478 RepID=A0A183ILJ3_9BILA|nr:unnamed protein product [Soboliphyme baturini]